MSDLVQRWRGSRLLLLCMRMLLLCLVLALSACAAPQASPLPAVSALTIDAPDGWTAGEDLPITVHAHAADGTSVFLIAHGSFESLPLWTLFQGGQAHFLLPATQTRTAGAVNLVARAGDQEATAQLVLFPGEPVDPILPLVGPRSIRVGGKEWTMVVAIPLDRYENPVADGTEVTIRAQHPADSAGPESTLEIHTVQTQRLFTWARIYSQTRAGRTLLAVNAGSAHSPERDVMEVPDLPLPFDLSAYPEETDADGRRLVTIISSPLVDRYGNVLLDGAAATLIAESGDGSRRSIPASVREGRLHTTIQAPAQADRLTLYADIAGVLSRPLTVPFVAAEESQPLLLTTAVTERTVTVIAGPMIGAIGQFVPDGTEVEFNIVHPDGGQSRRLIAAENGYARLNLAKSSLLRGEYQIRAQAGSRQGETGFTVR